MARKRSSFSPHFETRNLLDIVSHLGRCSFYASTEAARLSTLISPPMGQWKGERPLPGLGQYASTNLQFQSRINRVAATSPYKETLSLKRHSTLLKSRRKEYEAYSAIRRIMTWDVLQLPHWMLYTLFLRPYSSMGGT
jgi:hypothetical protein